MLPAIRRQKIIESLKNNKIMMIEQLSEILSVSMSTIRRDIELLEGEGKVVRLQGGGVKIVERIQEEPFINKKLFNSTEKDIIGKMAAEVIDDGDYVYIDSGTTALSIITYLKAKDVTIITSNTDLLNFVNSEIYKCILLGGDVDTKLKSTSGSYCEHMLKDMNFDKSFIGASGYVYSEGLFTFSINEGRKKRIVRSKSYRTYVISDSSKEGKRAFYNAFTLEDLYLITENGVEYLSKVDE